MKIGIVGATGQVGGVMRSIVADSMSVERFCTILLVVMAVVALLMAVVGLYSVMTFAVNERVKCGKCSFHCRSRTAWSWPPE